MAAEAQESETFASATVRQFKALSSVLMNRLNWANAAGITFNGRRDLYQILGYRLSLGYWDYRERYARDGIAKAVVEAYPTATWRGGVEVFEDENPENETAFEKAFKELDAKLAESTGSGFWQICQQVDILAGLSTYAVLLIGVADGGNLADELPKGKELLFLKPFAGGGGSDYGNRQRSAQQSYDAAVSIARYVTDPSNERYGEPEAYNIKPTTPGVTFLNREVHWSRVIHIAEGCLEDNVFGIPTLESVWNLFDDLAKVTGGGAEAHWLRANQGLHLDVDPKMGLPTTPGNAASTTVPGMTAEQVTKMHDRAEELIHQQARILVTRGVTATPLGSDVANFGSNADAILKQISGSKGIPMRILTGSEMGTLASEQDAANFDSRVQDRRTGYAGPKIAKRTLDRLIKYEILVKPAKYEVGWPVEENMDEKGKSEFALNLAKVNQTQGTVVITDDEIREMAFDRKPLTDAQKVPVAAPIRASDPNVVDPALANAPELKAALKALEQAIEDEDLDAIGSILGLAALPDGAQKFTIAKGLTRAQALTEARKRSKNDFRGMKYDAATGELKLLAEYKLSTTQVQLPDSFIGFGLKIPEGDLAEGGRESDPHVTVKYGLHTNEASDVRPVVAGRGPLTFTLGKTDYFAADGYDVLFVEVRSVALKRLNVHISRSLDVTNTQPVYVPHATIAYLKSGLGEKYAGDATFEGQQHTASAITFSNAEGERTVLPC